MADTTAAAAASSIDTNFASYMAELKLAGPHWERKPATAADGEAAWCARQVAEHIGGAEPFFGAGIAQAINVPGPTPARLTLESAPDAVAATEKAHAALMGVVAQVKDSQMALAVDHPVLGKQTLGGILAVLSGHLVDHTQQLKTLRGG